MEQKAARIVTRFARRALETRCHLTQQLVPFNLRFFTVPNVCCDVQALVRFYVRNTCADEHTCATPLCIGAQDPRPIDARCLLVLCLRTTTREDRMRVSAELSDAAKEKYLVPWTGMMSIRKLLHSCTWTIASVLLFRLGWDAMYTPQHAKRAHMQAKLQARMFR
jgi:hypothetical protein